MGTVPISQPTLPRLGTLIPYFKDIFSTKSITNSSYVQKLENDVRRYLKVKDAVCVSCATSGLILVIQALGLKGEVLVPSFTFPATVHALVWNNITPVFVDCERGSFNIDFEDLERKITRRTTAIMAVHVFGNPLDMKRLVAIARKHRLKVIIDGAHALGSMVGKKSVACFGTATVFSLAPTKLVTSAEGGIVATQDKRLADKIRLARNYGNPPDYNCRCIGLNARMSEIHAAVGIESFKLLPRFIKTRNRMAELYKKNLKGLPGIRFQDVYRDSVSTYNYFAIVIDKSAAGLDAAGLQKKLLARGIHTKRYFYPPVHRQQAYKNYHHGNGLRTTEEISHNTLCLPLFTHIKKETIDTVCDIMKKICNHA